MLIPIQVVLGDLTTFEADAVVNAANAALAGGGGLDGALHRAAGPALMEACRALPATKAIRCPPGEARLTPGFRLPARFVLHAVGPIYASDPDPAATLASAYRAALRLCEQHGLRSVGLPALACGVYGYPPEQAAPIAVGVCRERRWDLDAITFVLTSAAMVTAWRRALRERDGAS
ncbi:MAG: O-acetyl-ADP-ribose deacetylase [Pseudomonadota bacterium]|nr:O-acetyl-ADP-ribose deacetylase [Pseudomonadota bacterium]